jgi:hypothetical protein
MARILAAAAPDLSHRTRIATLTQVTWEVDVSGVNVSLTPWVDLGGGGVGVPATMTQTFMNYISLANLTTLVGRLVYVAMAPGPAVIDLVGSTKRSYPF